MPSAANISVDAAGNLQITHLNQYGISITEPLSNIPGYSALGLSPYGPNFHSYDLQNVVAVPGQYGLSYTTTLNGYAPNSNDAFEQLTRTPAPGVMSENGVQTGDIGSVPGLGPVSFSVNPIGLNVTNITLSTHFLSPGLVFQQAYTNQDGSVGIETIGLGNGRLPDLNSELSSAVFGSFNDSRITIGLQRAYMDIVESVASSNQN